MFQASQPIIMKMTDVTAVELVEADPNPTGGLFSRCASKILEHLVWFIPHFLFVCVFQPTTTLLVTASLW